MRIGALVVARQRPGTAKGITLMLIQESTPGASSGGGRSDQRRRTTRYPKVDPIEARNRNPRGTAETPGFVAETPSDGNAHRAMSPASTGVLGG